MLANLRDAEEHPSMQPPMMPPSRPSVPRLNEHEVGRPEDGNLPSSLHFFTNCIISILFEDGLRKHVSHSESGVFIPAACFVSVEAMTFLPSSGKSFILGRVDEAVSNELGLGELAGLTVANEADSLAYDVSKIRESEAENTKNLSAVRALQATSPLLDRNI